MIKQWGLSQWESDFLLYLLAALTPLTLFGKLMASRNLFYGDGSIVSVLLPRWAFDQALVRSGHMPPVWNFSVHNGVPWTAGGNSSHYWAYLLILWIFSLRTAHAVYVLGHFAVATCGFARLLRSQSMNWAACLLGGLLFISVGPVATALITGAYDNLACMCYWPWVCFFSLRLGQDLRPRDAGKLMLVLWAVGTTGLGFETVLALVLSLCFLQIGRLKGQAPSSSRLLGLWFAAISLPVLTSSPDLLAHWMTYSDPLCYGHLPPPRVAPLVSILTLISNNYFQGTSINQIWFDWFDGYCQLGPTCLFIPLILLTRNQPKPKGQKFILVTLTACFLLGLSLQISSLQTILPQGRQWYGPAYFLLVYLCSQAIDHLLNRPTTDGKDQACLNWLIFLGIISLILCYMPAKTDGLWGRLLTQGFGVIELKDERSQSILIAIYLRTLWALLIGSGLWIVRSIPPSKHRIALLSILIWSDLQGNLYPQIIQATPDLFTWPREVEAILSKLGPDDRLCLPTSRGGQALSLGASEVAVNIAPIKPFGQRFAELCVQPNYRQAIDAGSYNKYLVELGVRYFVVATKWSAVDDPKNEASTLFKEISSVPEADAYIYEFQHTLPRVFITDSWNAASDKPKLSTYDHTNKDKPIIQIAVDLPASKTKVAETEQVYNLGCFATQISVCAKVDEPRLICFRDSYSHLVEATIDGVVAELVPVNGGLVSAILCPKGDHRIVLKPKRNLGATQTVRQVALALGLSWLTFVFLGPRSAVAPTTPTEPPDESEANTTAMESGTHVTTEQPELTTETPPEPN